LLGRAEFLLKSDAARVASFSAVALGGQRFGSVLRALVAEGDSSSGLDEQTHGFSANTARAAGNQGNLAVERERKTCHSITLKQRRKVCRGGVRAICHDD